MNQNNQKKTMENKEIIEGNKLIAEFMGYKRHDRSIPSVGCKHWHIKTSGYFEDEELQYHSSWSRLMPVVEKINKDGKYKVRILFDANGVNGIYGCYIDKIEWVNNYLQDERISGFSNIDNPIESVYKAVVRFIKWYNNQKK